MTDRKKPGVAFWATVGTVAISAVLAIFWRNWRQEEIRRDRDFLRSFDDDISQSKNVINGQ